VDGFTLLEEVRTRAPALPVVVLSGSRRREDVMRALDRGAMGYIPKTSSSDVMLGALRLVMAGSVYLPPEALASAEAPEPGARGSVNDIAPQALGLTARQIDVLKLMLEGKPNKGISRELGLSPSTVKIHVAAILKAFDVDTRAQVIVEAGRRGFKY
jgi:DNA-binding NarL/FixJ family response regulator